MMSSSGSYVADTSGAAAYADGLTCSSKSDWFLGSFGEIELIYDNLKGLNEFVETYQWSSTEYATNATLAMAYSYLDGSLYTAPKSTATCYVRPIRSF